MTVACTGPLALDADSHCTVLVNAKRVTAQGIAPSVCASAATIGESAISGILISIAAMSIRLCTDRPISLTVTCARDRCYFHHTSQHVGVCPGIASAIPVVLHREVPRRVSAAPAPDPCPPVLPLRSSDCLYRRLVLLYLA